MQDNKKRIMKYEISDGDLKLIEGLLDVALRAGGLKNKPAVDRLVNLFAHPLPPEKVKEKVEKEKPDGNSKTPPVL